MSTWLLLFLWANTIKIKLRPGGLIQNGPHLNECNLLSPWYSWNIADLARNNTHSLTHSLSIFSNNTILFSLIWDRQPVWRTKSKNFNNTMIRTRYYLLFWMKFVADLIWLFRSFYLRHSSVESLVERGFFIRILFQVYFDFA